MCGFKKRFDIRSFTRHGEDASPDNLTEILAKMEEIKSVVASYDCNDVFNMDKACLFYRMEPNQTLTTSRLFEKKQKKCITIAFTANVTGCLRNICICLPPLIINHYLKLRYSPLDTFMFQRI